MDKPTPNPTKQAQANALEEFAELIDRGPDFPLPKSVFSAMARERAEDYRFGRI